MATLRMAFMRSYARSAGRIFARPYIFRHPSSRREYSSGKSNKSKIFEEALWAAGSIAVTIPSCWYLLSSRENHQGHHENHQHHLDDESDGHKENKPEESDEVAGKLTGEKGEVKFESDENQKDTHDSNPSDINSECTSCKESTEDLAHKASTSEPAGGQCENQDNLSSTGSDNSVGVNDNHDTSEMTE